MVDFQSRQDYIAQWVVSYKGSKSLVSRPATSLSQALPVDMLWMQFRTHSGLNEFVDSSESLWSLTNTASVYLANSTIPPYG